MKAILEFNLPEDKQDFDLATKGSKMYCTLWELDQWLRREVKHHERGEFDEVRERLRELMNDNRIDFDMVE